MLIVPIQQQPSDAGAVGVGSQPFMPTTTPFVGSPKPLAIAMEADCVIIGAGAAGLQTAASLLTTDDDVSLVLLEARDRVGGRIWSVQQDVSTVHGETISFTRDLGAAWIHGTGDMEDGRDKNPMVTLLEENDSKDEDVDVMSLLYPVFRGNAWTRPDTILHKDGRVALYVDGKQIPNDSPAVSQAIRQHYDLLYQLSQYIDSLVEAGEGSNLNQMSVKEVLEQIRKEQPFSESIGADDDLAEILLPFYQFLIENWNGLSMGDTQLSLMVSGEDDKIDNDKEQEYNKNNIVMVTDEDFICQGDYSGPHCKVRNGMATILEPLVTKIGKEKIRLNEKVVSIVDLGSQGIRVETSSGSVVTSNCCVSTIPLGCLQDSAEKLFHPRLSEEKMEAIQSIWSGAYKKVFLTFDTIFWPAHVPLIGLIRKDDTVSPDGLPGKHLLLNNLFAKDGVPSLEAVLCGDMGKWAIHKSDKVIQNEVLSFLGSAMGLEDVADSCISCHVTRWEEEDLTRGSYSTFCLGTKECHVDSLASPEWDGKLLFAGEPTESEHMGSVHAALMSGKRAADQVLTYLRREQGILSGKGNLS
ncbi:polyamine oxidase [Nitzschia inconspicua]|uniref:Polyamine oxidase n=1 Tax=Nitzschia inconspicua TaxID=303405 RepID=A0A9K3L4D4_9STRA|nr:polyamine oxidase [Nitzschia inconspicua]